jgi:hypothetical protein
VCVCVVCVRQGVGNAGCGERIAVALDFLAALVFLLGVGEVRVPVTLGEAHLDRLQLLQGIYINTNFRAR